MCACDGEYEEQLKVGLIWSPRGHGEEAPMVLESWRIENVAVVGVWRLNVVLQGQTEGIGLARCL